MMLRWWQHFMFMGIFHWAKSTYYRPLWTVALGYQTTTSDYDFCIPSFIKSVSGPLRGWLTINIRGEIDTFKAKYIKGKNKFQLTFQASACRGKSSVDWHTFTNQPVSPSTTQGPGSTMLRWWHHFRGRNFSHEFLRSRIAKSYSYFDICHLVWYFFNLVSITHLIFCLNWY